MKAKELTLRVVNEIEEGKFELKEFKPYMTYESFIGCILGEAEILRPTGRKDRNNREIYESDYLGVELEYDEFINPMCVTWNDKKCCWSLYINGCHEYDLDEFTDYDKKVKI
ncbi:YopX family protein [Clostridium senegalense]|uniref:YopX family protein n=1 Tax=Clostridium senegalense TaxID=1465809 RepID=UPI0002893369|nr:YopX family protein [Clostridium senegalense]